MERWIWEGADQPAFNLKEVRSRNRAGEGESSPALHFKTTMSKKKVYIVTDLGFGDSGKGGLVDKICSEHRDQKVIVVRHSGGPQCAHNVHVGELHHTFSQLGSGSFAGANTAHLSSSVISPYNLWRECEQFSLNFKGNSPLISLALSENCLVTTPLHVAANQEKERILRHGSCGQGYWETVSTPLKLTMKDFGDFHKFVDYMGSLLDHYKAQGLKFDSGSNWDRIAVNERGVWEHYWKHCEDFRQPFYNTHNESDLRNYILSHDVIVFEGNQGVLLDEDYGFYPHISGTSTPKHAIKFLFPFSYDPDKFDLYNWGVIRSYLSRHGAGPLPGEAEFTFKSEDNKENEWQGPFRAAPFNHDLISYALKACFHASQLTVNGIFISHCDEGFKHTTSFENKIDLSPGKSLGELEELGRAISAAPLTYKQSDLHYCGSLCSLPVIGRSYGPDRADKKIY